jgi:DUF1680 family protein
MQKAVTRRAFCRLVIGSSAVLLTKGIRSASGALRPLCEVAYGQVTVYDARVTAQAENTHSILMQIKNDDLIRPFRVMSGPGMQVVEAPGEDLGGWYTYFADFNYHIPQKVGFAPGSTFGQWVSALAKSFAANHDRATQEKILALNRMYAAAISDGFYEKTRFPAYTFDKLTCGLVDSASFAGDAQAMKILDAAANTAARHLPGTAVEWGQVSRAGKDDSYSWDESYTLPENLYRAYSLSGNVRFREMARRYLDDVEYFDPLAEGEPAIAGKHAYSHVNALNSAMQAYLVDGSRKHLGAAINGFDLVQAQSFATGGWGPDERLRMPGSADVFESLAAAKPGTHNSFETPCGAYGHMKLTRYLLRVTRDGRYGDSLERVLWNTVLGALPLRADGGSFYYQDVTFKAKKVYSEHTWPCCSGTLPQVAQDYGICSYFLQDSSAHGPAEVWVSQYFASVLRWREGGAAMQIEQKPPQGAPTYPFGDAVELHVTAARTTSFALKLRIPAWCEAASIRVNGRAVSSQAAKGFATVDRVWRNGDVVELELPMSLRLEGIDASHEDVAALMYGPLVLMALLPSPQEEQPKLTRQQALAAKRTGETEWTVATDAGTLRMAPYVAIRDEVYSTYLKLS